MKNDKLNMIVYFLAGVVITLLVITIVLLVLKSNEKKYETVYSDDKPQDVEIKQPVEDDFEEVEKSNDESKLKKGFTSVVDFLFYGEEINGITFNQLKEDSKTKVLKLALSIDQKIDDRFPNYKEKLSSKYQNVKSKIVESYINITTKICENNEQLCIDFKNDLSIMKEKFGITFDYLKEYGIKGIDKVKEWYENFRD